MIPVIGVAAVEGWSGNGLYYAAGFLKELHGITVPILWNHEGTPSKLNEEIPKEKIIGQCTVYWNGKCLPYAGEVKEEFKWCVEQAKGASIGAMYQSILKPFVGKIYLQEVSLVIAAGISAATVSEFDQASIMKLQSQFRFSAR